MSKSLATTQSIKGILAKKETTLTEVLAHVGPEAPNPPEVETPLPKSPALPKAVAPIAAMLPAKLAAIQVPTERRELDADELEELTVAMDEVKQVKAAVTKAEGYFKAAFFNHFDAVARRLGLVTKDSKRTKDGWFIIEDKVSAAVPGLSKKAVRETSSGSVQFGVDQLAELEAEGQITHAQFLAMTSQVRVVNEGAILAAIEADPDLAKVLGEKVTVSGGNAALYLRAND